MPIVQYIRSQAAIIFIAFASCFGTPVQAQDLQAIPPLSARVIDTSGTLDAVQTQALEAKLAAFEKARGAQIVILMVPTTLPEDITDYAQRVGDAWKIGRKDIGDGLLLLVAKNDRKVRIATTKTLEGAIPDLAARQIIASAITPRSRGASRAAFRAVGPAVRATAVTVRKLPSKSGDRSDPGRTAPYTYMSSG